jgi:hypothetical protein
MIKENFGLEEGLFCLQILIVNENTANINEVINVLIESLTAISEKLKDFEKKHKIELSVPVYESCG